jgi:hypothetical protein
LCTSFRYQFWVFMGSAPLRDKKVPVSLCVFVPFSRRSWLLGTSAWRTQAGIITWSDTQVQILSTRLISTL